MTTDDGRGRLLPNMEDHKCFGCSPRNASGLKMKFYAGDSSVYSYVTVPEHLCGWENVVHGGVLATILDEIMSRSVLYTARSLGMTRSMTIDFRKPAFVGQELRAEGRVLEVREGREARAEGVIYNGDGRICAGAVGVFALLSPDFIRKMGVAGERVLDFFNRHIRAADAAP